MHHSPRTHPRRSRSNVPERRPGCARKEPRRRPLGGGRSSARHTRPNHSSSSYRSEHRSKEREKRIAHAFRSLPRAASDGVVECTTEWGSNRECPGNDSCPGLRRREGHRGPAEQRQVPRRDLRFGEECWHASPPIRRRRGRTDGRRRMGNCGAVPELLRREPSSRGGYGFHRNVWTSRGFGICINRRRRHRIAASDGRS